MKRARKKLQLAREAVRRLETQDLARANGGVPAYGGSDNMSGDRCFYAPCLAAPVVPPPTGPQDCLVIKR
jgi:hypothetical protein